MSGHKTFQQQTKNSLESLQEQLERARYQNQLLAEQERLMQCAEREEERQYRREEKEEERQDRREEQEAERRRRKNLEDQQRQQKQQEEDRQLAYNIHPFSWHSPSPYFQQRQFYSSLPPQYPFTMTPGFQSSSFGPPPPAPQPQPYLETYLVSQKSSLISSELDDNQILHRFFEHKIIGQVPDVADKWQRAWHIVNGADSNVADLKEMEDGKSAMYQRAIAAGILDGFTRHFGAELRVFKRVHREEEEAAKALRIAGGFM